MMAPRSPDEFDTWRIVCGFGRDNGDTVDQSAGGVEDLGAGFVIEGLRQVIDLLPIAPVAGLGRRFKVARPAVGGAKRNG